MTARRPRIGITSEAGVAIAEYEHAVRAAGGNPIRLLPDAARGAVVLDDLDGVIFSGGEDVDPKCYGQAAHARTEPATSERDAAEIALVVAAYERAVPTLAICRGLQIANVAFGGSLHQHVPDVFGDAIAHQPQVDGATYRGVIAEHRVAIDAASRIATLTGTSLATGSRHHQSLDRIADPFRVAGRTPDGVVEALESADVLRFWLGVQWHPESTLALDNGQSSALFAALVAAAKDRSKGNPNAVS